MTLEFRKEFRAHDLDLGVSSSINGTEVTWMNGISDELSRDIKESAGWAQSRPQV